MTLTCSSATILPRSSSARSKCCSMATSNQLTLRQDHEMLVGPREELLGETHEKADAGRDGAVVEIVFGVVQIAAAFARAVAEPQHGAGPGIEQVGEILSAERRADVAVA